MIASVVGLLTLATTVVGFGPKTNPRVIVVGGGFAGLGAATALQEAGANVTLVEARTRLGGRAFTDMDTFPMPVDMGAMWIHGITANPVYALAQKYGVQTMPTNYTNRIYFKPDGTVVPREDIDPIYEQLLSKMNKIRNRANHDITLADTMEQAFTALGFSAEQQQDLRFKVCDEIELDVAATAKNLSGYNWDADDYLKGGDVLISDVRGYSAIVRPVAATLNDVQLNTAVASIDYTDGRGGVVLTTTDGDTIKADYVVVTSSLGSLKQDIIKFTPTLPSKLTNAIERLGCDVSDKVVLLFPKGSAHTWEGEGVGSGYESFYHMYENESHHGEYTENWNINHYKGLDMLMSFSVGPRDWANIEDSTKSDADITAQALAAIRTAYPSIPEPIQMSVHRWGNDKYASCTWSSWYLDSSPKDNKQFLKGTPDGRVLFAGEHTTTSHPGTTHGAWGTGLSAAAAIMDTEAKRTAGLQFDQDATAELRERLHRPAPEDVLQVPPMHSKRREWGRQQQQQQQQQRLVEE